ncbi:MAG: hypothetical protein WCT04_15910 [Planctomycetota bacterium]
MKKLVIVAVLSLGLSLSIVAAETPPGPMLKLANFRDVKLIDALSILADQTGLNLVASSEAGKMPVSLTLRNVPARVAVETLCKAHNLWFKEDAGIIRVMTTTEYQRDLTTFREEKTEVFTLLYPNAVAIAVAVRDLYGDRVQLSLGTEARSEESSDLNDRFDRFDVVDQRSQSLGLFEGSNNNSISSTGGGRGGSNSSSGYSQRSFAQRENSQRRRDDSATQTAKSDLLNLTPDQLQAMQQAAKNGDVDLALQQFRRRQADIYVTLSRRNNLVAVRSSDEKSIEEIGKLIRRLDVPTSVVLLEVKVLSIELSKDFTSAFDFQFSDGTSSAGGFTSGTIQPPVSDVLNGIARRNAPLALGGSGVKSGSLAFQYVNNAFRARLQMLEGTNKLTTLATPVLMTANNEVSRLFVGEERPIVRNINSNAVVNQTTVTNGSTTSIEFRPVGTTLLITPNINADRTVTLRILQENSTISSGGASIPVVTNNGLQQQAVDVVQTRSVSGTVVAQDGLTLAIGGLIEEGISDQRSQVPLLGSIPGVGVLFKRQNKNKKRSELVILIKPRILTTPSEGEAVSKELLERLSIHPKASDPSGTLNLYPAAEVLPLSR